MLCGKKMWVYSALSLVTLYSLLEKARQRDGGYEKFVLYY